MRSSGDERLLQESGLEEEGIPDIEGDPERMVPAGDDPDDIVPPPDVPVAATDYGVTAAEQAVEESVAQRSRREEPDFWEMALVDDDRVSPGRLVQSDEGWADDTEAEEVGFGSGDIYVMSAEEAAIRIVDEVDEDDLGLGQGWPGYLEEGS